MLWRRKISSGLMTSTDGFEDNMEASGTGMVEKTKKYFRIFQL